jgi:hypothetical protein
MTTADDNDENMGPDWAEIFRNRRPPEYKSTPEQSAKWMQRQHEQLSASRDWVSRMGMPFPGWDEDHVEAIIAWAQLEIEPNGQNGPAIVRRALEVLAPSDGTKKPAAVKKKRRKSNQSKGRDTIARRAIAALVANEKLKAVTNPRELCRQLKKLVGGSDRQWQPSGCAGRAIYGLLAQTTTAVGFDVDEPSDAVWDGRDEITVQANRFVKK